MSGAAALAAADVERAVGAIVLALTTARLSGEQMDALEAHALSRAADGTTRAQWIRSALSRAPHFRQRGGRTDLAWARRTYDRLP